MADLLHVSRHRNAAPQRKSFLVEALILLTVLMTSIAIFMSLFSSAHRMGNESVELDRAILMATDTAERFAANPKAEGLAREEDGLAVSCDIMPEEMGAGTLYRAIIVVHKGDKVLYRLTTARYLSREG